MERKKNFGCLFHGKILKFAWMGCEKLRKTADRTTDGSIRNTRSANLLDNVNSIMTSVKPNLSLSRGAPRCKRWLQGGWR